MGTDKRIWLYDTTLRDGAQREGISLSLEDKLKIARQLDKMGIPFIEGGWLTLKMCSFSGNYKKNLSLRPK